MGPCLCGDLQCPSCGPAQGNWRCPICRNWADDGCIHIDEESGQLKSEFRDEADSLARAEVEADAVQERLNDEYWQNQT